MNKHLITAAAAATFTFALALTAASVQASAVSDADKKAALDQPEIIYPQFPFDPREAGAMMAEGSVTVKGVIYNKLNTYGQQWGAGKQMLAGIEVYLYPATTHFVEWESAWTKHEKSQKSAWNQTAAAKLIKGKNAPKSINLMKPC